MYSHGRSELGATLVYVVFGNLAHRGDASESRERSHVERASLHFEFIDVNLLLVIIDLP